MITIRDYRMWRLATFIVAVLLAISMLLRSGPQQEVKAQNGSSPHFGVLLSYNHILGWQWPEGAQVTLTIDDPATSADPDYADTQTVVAQPGGTEVRFEPGAAFQVQPGHYATMSDGSTLKTQTVANLTLDGVDMVLLSFWGTADPGTVVLAELAHDNSVFRWETADSAGHWRADFSTPGDQPGEEKTHTIAPRERYGFIQQDPDGDKTSIDWQAPNPVIQVNLTQNQISGEEWPLGYPVELTIDNPNNGPGIDYAATIDPVPCPWQPDRTCLWHQFDGVYLVRPGHLVTMSNGFMTKTHTVSSLRISGFDFEADTISGSAEAGQKVGLNLKHPQGDQIQRNVSVGPDGTWLVDFSIPGDEPSEQFVFDLIPFDEGTVAAYDDDHNSTGITWPIKFWIEGDGKIVSLNWLVGEEVHLSIDDPSTPGEPDFTASGFPSVGPWAYSHIQFDIGDLFHTKPGFRVTLAQSGHSKTCVMSSLEITEKNYITDQVTGLSNPHAYVAVHLFVGTGDEGDRIRYVRADAEGNWTADYSQLGWHWVHHPDEKLVWDIGPGLGLAAEEADVDMDFTLVTAGIPLPSLTARLTVNTIMGTNFIPGTDVTVEIDDPGTSETPDFIQTKVVNETAPWNPAVPAVVFPYAPLEVHEGFRVTLTDGYVTKEHTVTALQLTGVDEDNNLVYGTASAGTAVNVVARSETSRASRSLDAEADGSWLADFSVPGPLPGEQDTFDLSTADLIFANQWDEDGDRTWVHWIENWPPEIEAISGPADPLPVTTDVQVSASFSDPDPGDTHTAVWDWGDDNTSEGLVEEEAGKIYGVHTYALPGLYTLGLTVTDAAGESDEAVYQYIVVFDPAAGFVTGGGWIWSESGWCQLDENCAAAEGKANFGFVSKYKKGASVPTGNTEFNFSAGGLNFHSDLYQWLVVNQGGARAQFKGSGTINGELAPNGEEYKFMIWATDGDNKDPVEDDTLRIKIWYEDSENIEFIVYDNGFDQAIGGGNIKIHKD